MMIMNGNGQRPLRVALYARVSTEDQAERETIQSQVEVANVLCPAMNLKIVESYLDDGISGTIPLEQRSQGARLLEDVSQDKFEQVVVYRLDGIGRRVIVIFSAWEILNGALQHHPCDQSATKHNHRSLCPGTATAFTLG